MGAYDAATAGASDAALAAHKRHPEKDGHKGLTLTGLLNSLDGFMAKDGSIVFMTTNHPELLDPALVRPGRVDFELEFKEATAEQKARLFKRFFPGATDALAYNFAGRDDLRTMAEAQQWLIQHKDDEGKGEEVNGKRDLETICCSNWRSSEAYR
ncbi:MAG TPA: AAA family ATPase [Candidatus Angelobacter sp.]|jgi:chaperone BCS1|nr:AAA family ATPase [Candidatus Angelobacter sp.]